MHLDRCPILDRRGCVLLPVRLRMVEVGQMTDGVKTRLLKWLQGDDWMYHVEDSAIAEFIAWVRAQPDEPVISGHNPLQAGPRFVGEQTFYQNAAAAQCEHEWLTWRNITGHFERIVGGEAYYRECRKCRLVNLGAAGLAALREGRSIQISPRADDELGHYVRHLIDK